MSSIIDRRLNGKNKSSVNRQRFLARYKEQIKTAVAEAIAKRSITEIDKGEKIIIPKKDIQEPLFQHRVGGVSERIFPGNKQFITGDKIERPPQNQGQGEQNASNQGEGADDFVFELSREEFLDLYFDDLELPDLVKKNLAQVIDYKYTRAGFTTVGTPTNINILRSMKQAIARRMALSLPKQRQLRELKKELQFYQTNEPDNKERIDTLLKEIKYIKNKIAATPFIDTFDLRYNNRIKQPFPSTQAVMFCLMDVSGSMDEVKKDIAKRFFILLYLFLTRKYQKIELVFIRHHTAAKEVNEEEFFYSRETGGTVVSSALELMRDIINVRYPSSAWNVYAAQASDGDNWSADSPCCQKILIEHIIPNVQYYSYIEIMPRHHQSLWEVYKSIEPSYPNFAMQRIDNYSDIYPVFRELFKRKIA